MKKITLIAVTLALSVMFVANGFSPHRTVKKESVKTEYASKIVKEQIISTSISASVAAPAQQNLLTTIFTISEANRPPGFKLAPANYAYYTDYKNYASIKPDKCKNLNLLISWGRTLRSGNFIS